MPKLFSLFANIALVALIISATFAPRHSSAHSLINLNMALDESGEVAVVGEESKEQLPQAVSSAEELKAYKEELMAKDPLIEKLNFTDQSVEVGYQEEGQFLALIPVKFPITVEVRASGEVVTKYPWYSVITVNKQKEIELEVKIAVDNALNTKMLGSVRGAGVPKEARFTPDQSAEVADRILEVIHNSSTAKSPVSEP